MVTRMATDKVTITVDDWLTPYLREAAARDGLSLSAWIARAAQVALYRSENGQRAEGTTDRLTIAERDERALCADLNRERVHGAV